MHSGKAARRRRQIERERRSLNLGARLSQFPLERLENRWVLATAALSIPTDLNAFQNGVVAVPVNVGPLSAGLSKADFAIDYDPSVFTVSASDVFLGAAPASGNNWVVNAVNLGAGELGITISSATPLSSSLGVQIPSGTVDPLIYVDFHVQGGAALGNTPINLAANNSAGPTTTDLIDANGNLYTLNPAPTNGSSDAGVDGSVNIESSASAPPIGTWSGDPGSGTNVSPLTLPPTPGNPTGIGTMLQLPDGTIMANGGSNGNSQDWWQLTPNNGSYATGSWSQLASMTVQRRFFGSTVLQDGQVMVLGGEYSSVGGDTNTGELFTPPTTPGGTGSWQTITPIPTGTFGDGQLDALSDGTVLAGFLGNGQTWRYNPANDPLLHPSLPAGTQPWTKDAVMLNGDRPNEESFVKLPGGKIMTYEIFGTQPQTGQIWVPGATQAQDQWTPAGTVPVTLATSGVNALDAITSAIGTGGANPIQITSFDPLPSVMITGSCVKISGVTGFPAANGTFSITVTGSNTFTLNNTTGDTGSSTPSTGTWSSFAPSDSIAAAVGTGGANPIQITSTNPLPAGMPSGAKVTISGITGFSAVNGTFFITVTGANTFTLNGTNGTTGTANPNTGNWSTPSGNIASGAELGPGFLLPDGDAFYVGATTNTALYDPTTNTWSAGPTIPNGVGANDAPGAVLPNGRVLFMASATPAFGPGTNSINPVPTGSSLYEYDPVSNTITQVANLPPVFNGILTGQAAFVSRMLVLPSGQVMITDSDGQPYIYTPAGSPQAAWRPVITSITNNGSGTFTLTGTQLNGLDEGAAYGDDAQMDTNFPIVELQSGGNTYFARTFNWSSTNVATGTTPETTQFTLPAGTNLSDFSSVTVVANGIASLPANIVNMNGSQENLVIRVNPADSTDIQVLVDGTGQDIADFPNNSANPILVFGDGNNNRLVVDETYGNVNTPINFDGGGSPGAPATGCSSSAPAATIRWSSRRSRRPARPCRSTVPPCIHSPTSSSSVFTAPAATTT